MPGGAIKRSAALLQLLSGGTSSFSWSLPSLGREDWRVRDESWLPSGCISDRSEVNMWAHRGTYGRSQERLALPLPFTISLRFCIKRRSLKHFIFICGCVELSGVQEQRIQTAFGFLGCNQSVNSYLFVKELIIRVEMRSLTWAISFFSSSFLWLDVSKLLLEFLMGHSDVFIMNEWWTGAWFLVCFVQLLQLEGFGKTRVLPCHLDWTIVELGWFLNLLPIHWIMISDIVFIPLV